MHEFETSNIATNMMAKPTMTSWHAPRLGGLAPVVAAVGGGRGRLAWRLAALAARAAARGGTRRGWDGGTRGLHL